MPSELTTLTNLFTRSEFWTGFALGATGLVVLYANRRRSDLVGWGGVVAIATVLGVGVATGWSPGLALGIGSLAAGGWALDRHQAGRGLDHGALIDARVWGPIALGGYLIAFQSDLTDSIRISIGAVVVAIVGGYLMRAWGEVPQRRWLGLLWLISTFGVWITIPETDNARVLLGAAVPLSIATASPTLGRLSSAGAFGAVAIFSWIAATGGAARPSSIVSAWAALGVLLLLPSVAPSWSTWSGTKIVTTHVIWVLVVTRVFGLWKSTLAALFAVVLGVGVVFLYERLSSSSQSGSE